MKRALTGKHSRRAFLAAIAGAAVAQKVLPAQATYVRLTMTARLSDGLRYGMAVDIPEHGINPQILTRWVRELVRALRETCQERHLTTVFAPLVRASLVSKPCRNL